MFQQKKTPQLTKTLSITTFDCIRDVPLHNFVVLLGDLNDRIGPSNTHLKTVGRYPTMKKPMTMVID